MLLTVCFPQFLGEWGGSGCFKRALVSLPYPYKDQARRSWACMCTAFCTNPTGSPGANFNHHLSLPDSGWLRLLVKLFWGLDSHQITTGWGPPLLSAQCRKHDTWMFHKQKISIIITSFTISLVDTIPLIVDQHLHSVWELPAKAVNIMAVICPPLE